MKVQAGQQVMGTHHNECIWDGKPNIISMKVHLTPPLSCWRSAAKRGAAAVCTAREDGKGWREAEDVGRRVQSTVAVPQAKPSMQGASCLDQSLIDGAAAFLWLTQNASQCLPQGCCCPT